VAFDRGRVSTTSRSVVTDFTSRWPTAEPPSRGFNWLKAVVVLVAGVALLLAITFGLLFYADFSMAGNGSSDPSAQVAWAFERGDHFHFAGHLLIARVFDVCPCSRRAAAAQYYYAHFHAVTPLQKSVVGNTSPHSLGEFAAYVTGPFAVGAEWMGDGIAWLRGNRPPRAVLITLDQYEFSPAEIHVPRGTTVTWRNVDELGEPHTVTSRPNVWQLKFDSRELIPGEQFQATFTERGRYAYYCRIHGAPDSDIMSGTVVVD
jgi:plastocyanin